MKECQIAVLNADFSSFTIEEEIFKSINGTIIQVKALEKEAIMEGLKDADVVMVQYTILDKEIIDSLENCKIILRYGIGLDNIDLDAAARNGIYVANVPDYGVIEVADHAMTLLLALARKLPVYSTVIKEGEWGFSKAVPIHRLEGRKLGLIGFGTIARKVAKRAQAFGLEVTAYDPYVDEKVMNEAGVKKADSVSDISKSSDFVSLHVGLFDETRLMINNEFINNMKDGSFIINTARGPLVDFDALIPAIKSKKLGGAAIDVFMQEPLARDDELRTMEGLILTPHAAYYSEEALQALHILAAEEVVRVIKGELPRHFCNKKGFIPR